MAIYISIKKTDEQDTHADNAFGLDGRSLGVLRISKSSGDVVLLKETEGDADLRIYSCAAYKIKKYWANEEYPAITCWAS